MTHSSSDVSLGFRIARKDVPDHPVRHCEVPSGDYVSLALPTCRWREPAYACFSSTVVSRPDEPAEVLAPGRWWAISALDGSLLTYQTERAEDNALVAPEAVLFPPGLGHFEPEHLRLLDDLMDQALPAFFHGRSTAKALREDVVDALAQAIPQVLTDWYVWLASDLYKWLRA